jgi:hypothetical protein
VAYPLSESDFACASPLESSDLRLPETQRLILEQLVGALADDIALPTSERFADLLAQLDGAPAQPDAAPSDPVTEPASPAAHERRARAREPVLLSATVTSQFRSQRVLIGNMSVDGVFLKASKALKIGRRATLRCGAWMARGHIVWSAETGAGMRFDRKQDAGAMITGIIGERVAAPARP